MKINRLLFIASIVFVAFIALSGCAKREIKNIGSQGENIICFGDSMTFGYGVQPGEDYPTALSKLLGKPVINAGVDGDTTNEALLRIKTDVLAKHPFLVIIEFGGNDFVKQIPKEKTLNNIREMVDLVQQKGAMVAIVDISASLFFSEYKREFSKLAKEKGTIFIPHILSGIITNPSLKSDFLHPNAEGYKIIAQRIYRAIIPYLNQNPSQKHE